MKIGIIGLPGSGKSTVFEAVTGISKEKLQREPGKAHIGTIEVPDTRLDSLAGIFKPRKVTRIEITFEDMPGYNVKQIKELDALVCVLGVFCGTDPLKDLDNIEAASTPADDSTEYADGGGVIAQGTVMTYDVQSIVQDWANGDDHYGFLFQSLGLAAGNGPAFIGLPAVY